VLHAITVCRRQLPRWACTHQLHRLKLLGRKRTRFSALKLDQSRPQRCIGDANNLTHAGRAVRNGTHVKGHEPHSTGLRRWQTFNTSSRVRVKPCMRAAISSAAPHTPAGLSAQAAIARREAAGSCEHRQQYNATHRRPV
jgi:hypothetical protein